MIANRNISVIKHYLKRSIISAFGTAYYENLENIYLKNAFRKNGLIFIHIPKSAGSSVSKILYKRNMGHHPASELKRRMPKLFNDMYKFSIVRNPYKRLISTYDFIKSKGTTHGWVNWYKEYDDKSFNNFQSFVLDWLPKYGIDKTGLLLKKQSSYLFDEKDSSLVDFIGRLEDLEDVNIILSKKLNRKVSIPHINANIKSINDYRINEDMKKIILRFYGKDFELLQYDK